MPINLLNSYGIKNDQQLEYNSKQLKDTVLLVGDSVYTPNNPKNLPVYWESDLDVIKKFVKLGGQAEHLHLWMREFPGSRLGLKMKDIPFWDHSEIKTKSTATPKTPPIVEVNTVFRLQESLSEKSIKMLRDIKKAKHGQ